MYSGKLYLDRTIGRHTKLGFKYTNEVDVKVKTDYNHTVTISRNKDLKLIIAVIKGDVVSYTLILQTFNNMI